MISFAQFPLLHVAMGSKDLSEVSDCWEPRMQWPGSCQRGPTKRQGGMEPEEHLILGAGGRQLRMRTHNRNQLREITTKGPSRPEGLRQRSLQLTSGRIQKLQ